MTSFKNQSKNEQSEKIDWGMTRDGGETNELEPLQFETENGTVTHDFVAKFFVYTFIMPQKVATFRKRSEVLSYSFMATLTYTHSISILESKFLNTL